MVNRITDILKNDVFNADYSLTEKILPVMVLSGVISHSFFYIFLKYYSEFNEHITVKLITISLIASLTLILKNRINDTLRKWYYESVLIVSFPFYFSFMLLLNDLNLFWSIAMIFCGFIYGLLAKLYVLPVGYITGGLCAYLLIGPNQGAEAETVRYLTSFQALSLCTACISNAMLIALDHAYRKLMNHTVEKKRFQETEKHLKQLEIAEKQLRDSEAKYRLLIENAFDGIVVIQDGFIRFTNRRLEAITGYSLDEIIDQPFLRFLPEEDHARASRAYELRLSGVNKIGREQYLIYTKQNKKRWVEVNSAPCEWNGKAGLINFISDITDKKTAEDALQQHKNKLEEIVRERTATLEATNEELVMAKNAAEAATHAKSSFLANMSHEIRTPMNAVIGVSDLLSNTRLSVKQQEHVNIIKSSSRVLLSLINDILDFSKIEAGKLEFEEIPFVLGEVIDEVSDMFRDKIQEKELEFIIDIDANVPQRLISDPLRLKQVLVNLTSNALKFTHYGEICISVKQMSHDNDVTTLQFSVRDTGIGIDSASLGPEGIDSLFRAFSQGDISTTRHAGGTGLGLSITKKIVEMINGSIRVESRKGEGSTFIITGDFKYLKGETALRAIMPEALKGVRVLIADDNPVTLMVIRRFTESFGFRPETAETAGQAIEMYNNAIAKGDSYNLVIMDIRLPDIDGITAAEKIRSNHSITPPPVIFISASDYGRYIHRFGKESIDNFLTKPVKQSVLFDTIMNAFGYKPDEPGKKIINTAVTENLAGATVLLVEDNPVNQMVATEILISADINVHKAGTGYEAIELLQEQTYDAVLMDIQMPDLDGINATRIIRRDLKLTTLPIIAMTANAMTGDREKCIESGMNDYISKPIESRQIYTVLSRWVRTGKQEESTIKSEVSLEKIPEETPSPARDPMIPKDLPGININDALNRINGNRRLLIDLMNEFYTDNAETAEKINQAMASGNIDYAATLIHTVKGSSGNISARALHDVTQQMEESLSQTQSLSDDLFGQFRNALAEALDSAGKFRASVAPTESIESQTKGITASLETSELCFMLKKLKDLLEENSFSAEAYLHSIIRHLDPEKRSDAKPLLDHVTRLEYAHAKLALKAFAERMNMEI